jgi:hypothetical protein
VSGDQPSERSQAEAPAEARIPAPPRARLGEHLRIEQRGVTPRGTRIWLNGMELTCVVKLELAFGNHEATTAALTISVADIEVDAETMLHLRAVHDAGHR